MLSPQDECTTTVGRHMPWSIVDLCLYQVNDAHNSSHCIHNTKLTRIITYLSLWCAAGGVPPHLKCSTPGCNQQRRIMPGGVGYYDYCSRSCRDRGGKCPHILGPFNSCRPCCRVGIMRATHLNMCIIHRRCRLSGSPVPRPALFPAGVPTTTVCGPFLW